jgi:hypothetical protein
LFSGAGGGKTSVQMGIRDENLSRPVKAFFFVFDINPEKN